MFSAEPGRVERLAGRTWSCGAFCRRNLIVWSVLPFFGTPLAGFQADCWFRFFLGSGRLVSLVILTWKALGADRVASSVACVLRAIGEEIFRKGLASFGF